ncbi:MAG TPA: hypothetical protein P5123_00370 [Spirochaetota bacterium]|nr:hypothetical protein [Spirochaetota bacterium]
MKKLFTITSIILALLIFISCEDDESETDGIKNAVLDLQDAYNSGSEAEITVLFSEGSNAGGSGIASMETLKDSVGTANLEFTDISTSESGDTGSATAYHDDDLGMEHKNTFTLVKSGEYWDFTEWIIDGTTTLDRK